VNSGVSANTAGQVIDGLEVHGDISITANNVTIKNTKVFGRINVGYTHSGVLIQDVEVDHSAGPTTESSIGDTGFTCIRCYVHGIGSGIRAGDNVTVQDSYVFIGKSPGDTAHKTALGDNGGAHLVFKHNNLSCIDDYCSAAFSLYGDFAQIDDVLVQNNLFNTTGSYCTYGGSVASKPYPHATNVRYLDNHFGRVYSAKCGQYGPLASWENNTGNVWSGNVRDDTGQPVYP
jgi:hypothetical protein